MSGECEKCGEHTLDCLCHMSKWISVKDKLPNTNEEVLYAHSCKNCLKDHVYNPKIWICRYDPEDEFWPYPKEYYIYANVTHWMSLPELPHD